MELPELGIPGLPGLLSTDGRTALTAFLTERRWTADRMTPVQLLCRLGHSASATFEVAARHRSGADAVLTVTVACRPGPDPAGLEPVAFAGHAGSLPPPPVGEHGPYTVWLYPHDPVLPGLPAAAGGACLPDTTRDRCRHLVVERVAYRPRHRAVMRYRTGDGSGETLLFAKVLRPGRARAVWAQSGPVKEAARHLGVRLALPFARRSQGMLLSRPLPGRRLRSLLLEPLGLPAPSTIAELPARIAALARAVPPDQAGAAGRVAHAGWTRSAAGMLGALLPERAERVEALSDRIAAAADADPGPTQFVHGDLHEGQILVAPDGRLGLVDLDDLGYGDPALDAATLSAHLLILAGNSEGAGARQRILAYREEVRTACLKRLDCAEGSLRWREAYQLLLLANGPLRVLRPDWRERVISRIDLTAAVMQGQA